MPHQTGFRNISKKRERIISVGTQMRAKFAEEFGERMEDRKQTHTRLSSNLPSRLPLQKVNEIRRGGGGDLLHGCKSCNNHVNVQTEKIRKDAVSTLACHDKEPTLTGFCNTVNKKQKAMTNYHWSIVSVAVEIPRVLPIPADSASQVSILPRCNELPQ